jgi:4-amino-4-deoxy-L-arabinose transferase-like glycosyltransferase
MGRSWPQIRYWCALSVSFAFALTILNGLAMGGPDGPIGWIAVAGFLVSPVAILWTRWSKAAAPLQNFFLLLGALAVGYLALVASLSS